MSKPPRRRTSAKAPRIRKAVKFGMIAGRMSVLDKFRLLKDLGYDGVEMERRARFAPRNAAKASEATGLPIHGLVNGQNPDLKGAIDLARHFGATSVLVVAGRVNEASAYDHVYRTTQEWIRRALDYAEKMRVKLLVENVWNNFLLSPLEMARYLDELDSDWVGAYFDVGNVVRFGWPDQWIRILARRIGRLDIKEYSRAKQRDEGLWKGFQVDLGEGDCDWPAVRKALAEIGYDGWATAEVPGGGRDRLAEIARRMDRVLGLRR
jgi:hexulose-6-phosphate isomerase